MKKTKRNTAARLKLFKTVARDLTPKETANAVGGVEGKCPGTDCCQQTHVT